MSRGTSESGHINVSHVSAWHPGSGPGAEPGEVDALMWTVTFQRALAVLNRKWVVSIVRVLERGPSRAFQIRLEIKGIQQKVLRETLKALEADGLVQQVIIRDETSSGIGWELTADGQSLVEPVAAIFRWGRDHLITRVIDLTEEASLRSAG